jgi:hypothetical protein
MVQFSIQAAVALNFDNAATTQFFLSPVNPKGKNRAGNALIATIPDFWELDYPKDDPGPFDKEVHCVGSSIRLGTGSCGFSRLYGAVIGPRPCSGRWS